MHNYNVLIILYGCDTWSFILREDHILNMSVDRAPRRIFGSKIEEIIGGRKASKYGLSSKRY